MRKQETFLPLFNGFYESHESQAIDDITEQELEYFEESGITKEDGTPIEWNDFNYSAMFEDLSKDITNLVEGYLKDLNIIESLVYQSTWSPREYNFKTDTINIEISLTKDNEKAILKYIEDNQLQFNQFIKDSYTSYSGFYSSYSNDPYEFLEAGAALSHSHKLGAILGFILDNEGIREEYTNDLYEIELMTYLNDNIELTEAKETI